jgi:alkylation response protein AidB-like acyl-CoA dehydrogenase
LELAKGDLSACWIVYATNAACWLASTTSDACQEALFGAGPKVVCGATYPIGTAQEVDRGYIVDGAWNYASGCHQADWGYGGVTLTDRKGTVVAGQGTAFFAIADVEIKNTWHVTGLRASGSDTMVAKKLFVPAVHMVMPDKSFGAFGGATKYAPTPLDHIQTGFGVRVSGYAQLVGGAQAMLDMMTASPPDAMSGRGRSVTIHKLEKVAAQIDAARTALFDLVQVLDESGRKTRKFTLAERARQKAQCGVISELVHEAAESMMFVAGSSAFERANPLNRYWRDLHMGLRHTNHVPSGSYEGSWQDRIAVWSSPA